ncbi:hypothetical protein BJF90_04410 [Pseudonocardia sp. CNS-004]|nr:hypothetical protein BJF90_04410 [Pseudonocardia sp. CNS-004]
MLSPSASARPSFSTTTGTSNRRPAAVSTASAGHAAIVVAARIRPVRTSTGAGTATPTPARVSAGSSSAAPVSSSGPSTSSAGRSSPAGPVRERSSRPPVSVTDTRAVACPIAIVRITRPRSSNRMGRDGRPRTASSGSPS